MSYVNEANRCSHLLRETHFKYDSQTPGIISNHYILKRYQVVIFLDTRPGSDQREKRFKIIWIMEALGWDFILPHLH